MSYCGGVLKVQYCTTAQSYLSCLVLYLDVCAAGLQPSSVRALPSGGASPRRGRASCGAQSESKTRRIFATPTVYYYLRMESNYHSPPRAGVHDPGLNWVVGVEYMDRAQGPIK